MNIRPLADRVLILPAPAEEKTIGGIIIPDTAKEKPLRGEVIAAGNGTKDEEMVLKGRRPRTLWQICRYGNRTRRHEVPDYASERRTRHSGINHQFFQSSILKSELELWLKKYYSTLMPATS